MERNRLDRRNEDEDIAALLAALGRAERARAQDAGTQGAWAGVERALARPGLAVRLPLAWAGMWRLGALLGRPAFAASLVAAGAGLGIGAWLGMTAGPPLATAVASDLYAASGLDAAPTGGFEAGLLDVQEPAAAASELGDGGARDDGVRDDAARGDTTRGEVRP